MSIISKLSSFFGAASPPDKDTPLDTDSDGKVLFKDDIIADVLNQLEKRRTERSGLEQRWILNSNFLVGNQYCEINTHRGSVEQLPEGISWQQRDTFNQIAPLIETRIANLKKINYRMKVRARTNELEDYAKASVSTSILQYLQSSSDFDSVKNIAIAWNELCGNCFFLSWWDNNKGEEYARETIVDIDENGAEIKNEKVYRQGDLDYGLITPWEVFPESIYKQTVKDQRSIIIEQVKSVEDVKDLYGIDVEGGTVTTFQLTPIAAGGSFCAEYSSMSMGTRSVEDAVKVVTYFERPSNHLPNGKMIIIVGGDNLVYYGDLPYSRIPIVQVKCREVAGQFFGRSAIEDLIPRQRAYNGCLNKMHDYIMRAVNGGYVVDENSIVDIENFEENAGAPGAIILKHTGTANPSPLQIGSIPSEIMQERYNLKSDMEYVAGTSQLMVNGSAPTGVTSGTAIQNLMEIDNTRLSLTGDFIRNAVKDLAILWLEIYKRYANTRRILNYTGLNEMGKVLEWDRDDINSYDVEYTTENELLTSEQAQKETFMTAYGMGLFTDNEGRVPERAKQRMLEYMKLNNYSEIMSINTLHMQAAQRENSFFEDGIIPERTEFDDDSIHYDEHLRYILSMKFQILKMKKPQYAKALEQHTAQHKQAMEQSAVPNLAQMMPNIGGN